MATKFQVEFYSGKEETVSADGFEVQSSRNVIFFENRRGKRENHHLRTRVKSILVEFAPPPEEPYGDPSRYKLPVVE